ncbi:MAG: hypothetical protein M3342_18010 [Bacteroidota bacterium]|nr:hypothetical protein [Bacteroidota bacterium]
MRNWGAHLIEDLQKHLPGDLDIDTDTAFWKGRIENTVRPFDPWSDSVPKKKSQTTEQYLAISQNFLRYMHEAAGLSWISVQYYARLISEYLLEYQNQKKGGIKSLFDFSKKMVDIIIGKLCFSFLMSDTTKVLGLLNAVYYFAAYLQRCGNIDEKAKTAFQSDCRELYNEHYKLLKERGHSEALCFPVFPLWEEK